jgi:hypothetical protein
MAFSNQKKRKEEEIKSRHSIFPTQYAIESDEEHSIWHPKLNLKKHAEKPKPALLIMPFITRGKNMKKEGISSHLRFSIGMASSDVGSTAAAVAAASKVLVLSTATHLKGFLHTKPPLLFTATTPEEAEERKSESLRREQIGNDDAAVMLTSKVRDDDDDEEALLTNNTEDAAAATRALPETRAATESMTKNTTEKRPKNKGGEFFFKNKPKQENLRNKARNMRTRATNGEGEKKTRAWRRDSSTSRACVGGLVGVCASASDRDGVGGDDVGRAGLGRGSLALISIKWRLS